MKQLVGNYILKVQFLHFDSPSLLLTFDIYCILTSREKKDEEILLFAIVCVTLHYRFSAQQWVSGRSYGKEKDVSERLSLWLTNLANP